MVGILDRCWDRNGLGALCSSTSGNICCEYFRLRLLFKGGGGGLGLSLGLCRVSLKQVQNRLIEVRETSGNLSWQSLKNHAKTHATPIPII